MSLVKRLFSRRPTSEVAASAKEPAAPIFALANTAWQQTQRSFDELRDETRLSGTNPWAQPKEWQTLYHKRWISLVYSTCALKALGPERPVVPALNNGTASWITPVTMAEMAASEAVEISCLIDVGEEVSLVEGYASYYPIRCIALCGGKNAWEALEALHLLVRDSLQWLELQGVATQYEQDFHKLNTRFLKASAKLAYEQECRDSWVSLEAQDAAEELFMIGQLLWTPYLIPRESQLSD